MVICEICFKSFKNYKGLRIHKGKVHKDILNSRKIVLHEIESQADEIRALKTAVSTLVNEIRSLRVIGFSSPAHIIHSSDYSLSHSTKQALSHPSTPIGMNYGCDHGALMDELKSVLKERVASA
ncbi:MAG: hypothetical protein KAI34_04905 [Candidatus Lokiarchaeota archaeon]|nr:hypothetical protein [Candidatus Lokiarchaeota archaeon]